LKDAAAEACILDILKGSNYRAEVTVKLLDNIHSILPALSLRG
jgi:hypothetical protein